MKKIQISDSVKKYIKLIVIMIIVFYIFYLLVKFGGFIFACYGFALGSIVAAIKEYIENQQKERYFNELEEKIKEYNIDKENNNNV